VLDFGLAKAYAGDTGASSSADLFRSPTLARTGTEAGLILGTASYMSPEQARGRRVDKRTDIWAFGALLFELLTGGRAFAGETVTDVLAAVVQNEPPWERLPAEVPAGVRRLLRRCLRKNADERLHDIADARLEIDEALRSPGDGSDDASTAGRPGSRAGLPRRLVLVALAAAGLAGVAIGASWSRRTAPAAVEPVRRLSITGLGWRPRRHAAALPSRARRLRRAADQGHGERLRPLPLAGRRDSRLRGGRPAEEALPGRRPAAGVWRRPGFQGWSVAGRRHGVLHAPRVLRPLESLRRGRQHREPRRARLCRRRVGPLPAQAASRRRLSAVHGVSGRQGGPRRRIRDGNRQEPGPARGRQQRTLPSLGAPGLRARQPNLGRCVRPRALRDRGQPAEDGRGGLGRRVLLRDSLRRVGERRPGLCTGRCAVRPPVARLGGPGGTGDASHARGPRLRRAAALP